MLLSAMSSQPHDFTQYIPRETLKAFSVPNQTIRLAILNADAIAHFFGAIITTLLLLLSTTHYWIDNKIKRLSTLMFILIFLFFIVETMQLIIGRNFGLLDLAAGSLGAMVSILCFGLLTKT